MPTLACLAGDASALFQVFRFLGAEDLSRASCVAKPWSTAAGSPGLWKPLCESLWESKVHVAQEARDLLASGEAHRAYVVSIEDSRRQRLTMEEITSYTWFHRMKASAGQGWLESDPYWLGKPSNQRRFTENGDMACITPSDPDAGVEIRQWRWVSSGGGRTGSEQGSFIRHSVNGRDRPTQMISRHPRNWGWIMQNCWSITCSFPLPLQGEDPDLDDDNLAVTVEDQQAEAMVFNLGLGNLPDNWDGRNDDVDAIQQMLAQHVAAHLLNADATDDDDDLEVDDEDEDEDTSLGSYDEDQDNDEDDGSDGAEGEDVHTREALLHDGLGSSDGDEDGHDEGSVALDNNDDDVDHDGSVPDGNADDI